MDKPPDMRPSSNYINNGFIYFRNITKVVWALLFVSTAHFFMISELISDFDLLKKAPHAPLSFSRSLAFRDSPPPPPKKKREEKRRDPFPTEKIIDRACNLARHPFLRWLARERGKPGGGGGGGCHFRGKMGDYWLSW